MNLQLQIRSVLEDLGFRFDPNQPRDPDGKWGDGAGVDLDMPDLDEDDEEDDDPDGEDAFDNDRFPAAYTAEYGNVVDEIDVGAADLFVAVTDKGSFHVARGEADRQVVAELNSAKARSLARQLLLFNDQQPEHPKLNRPTGATLTATGDGGVRIDWKDGSSSDLDDDGAFSMQEILNTFADRVEESEDD